MSKQTNQGPCGVPLGDIVDLADRIGRLIAALGVTDPSDRNTFCTLLGETLTAEFLSTGAADELRPYQDRLADIGGSAAYAYFTSDALTACAALGPYREPATKMRRPEAGIWALVTNLVALRKIRRIPPSEFLDLLVWVQSALAMPVFLEAHPELAGDLGIRRAGKRGKRRSEKRRARTIGPVSLSRR